MLALASRDSPGRGSDAVAQSAVATGNALR
jgi:hypothetical protein